MEGKETFICEKINESGIDSLKYAFCFSLLFQLARFKYEGLAAKTLNEIKRIATSPVEHPQITSFLQNKSSVDDISNQLNFSSELNKKEFVYIISKITRSDDVNTVLKKLAETLKIMIRTVFYEGTERFENQICGENDSNTIMITLFYENQENEEKIFYKTQSSFEALFDKNSERYREMIRFHPFTFNKSVCAGDYNLSKVNILLAKSLKKQIDFIPISKLEAAISVISGFEQAEYNALLRHSNFECTHPYMEYIQMSCCNHIRCKHCLKEKAIKRNKNCFCGQRINDNDIERLT